jgi:hypothetical protein
MERATLRPFILISALLVFASPAVAQSWQEYSYPDHSFTATFPADPQIEATTYRVTDDRKVEALIYFVRRDNAEFKVTVAELADAGLEPAAVVDCAIKTLSKGGEVKVNLPHHIMSVFGRQLSIVERDGSRVMVALFAYHGRLYQIEGKSFPAGNDATAPSDSCSRSCLPAAALTPQPTSLEPPSQLAADHTGLATPEFLVPRSPMMAAVLK